MTRHTNNARRQNLLLIAFLISITLFTAFHEGYLSLISILFWSLLIAGFAVVGWLALSISTKRLLALILSIFIIEYVKETIGIRSEFWSYQGIGGFYNFGVWAWVLGGLTVYTLSTKIVIRLLRKLKLAFPKWLNPVILFLLFLLIPLTMGPYRDVAGGLFWLFYVLLLLAGIYFSIKMDVPVFVGVVLTAWIVSNPSEYAGSVSSKVWIFLYNPDYPPLFLLFGCWPLEILVQYSLSALLANESLT